MEEQIIELYESKKFLELKKYVNDINSNDLAEILNELDTQMVAKVFRLIRKDAAVEVFALLEVTTATELIQVLSEKETVSLLDEMPADDATDILEEMPANIVDKLLKKCSYETRKDINRLLNYKEDSAGSIMTVEYAELKEGLTISRAIDILKEEMDEYETINTCFVLDKNRKLVGTVQLTDLLFADKKCKIKSICNRDLIYVTTSTDQEEVADLFQKYDITVMAVVDSEKRLVGIITIDDVIDVIEAEATEDMKKMAAIIPIDKPYDKTSVWEMVKARLPWLLLLMISATFTGKIIQSFEDQLATCAVLTAFIPMLMDTGGNAGGQTSASIIRALSLNDIEFSDLFRVVFKEFKIAILCSAILAVCNFVKIILIDRVEVMVSLVVCLTMVATIVIAKTIGCLLPMVAKRVGFDPAVMASPLITTIVDACSLIVYFQIARLLLHI